MPEEKRDAANSNEIQDAPIEITGEEGAMARIEALLKEQSAINKELLLSSKVRTIIVMVIAAVLLIGILVSYNMIEQRTRGVEQLLSDTGTLIASTTELVDMTKTDLADVLQGLRSIDFRLLEEGIEGFGTINFETMNESVKALYDAIKPFADFMNMVG